MDWEKLTQSEVKDFIRLYGPVPTDNLYQFAAKLFQSLQQKYHNEFNVTEPVYDLYIATLWKSRNTKKYRVENIRTMNDKRLLLFAERFNIPPSRERVIRILRYMEALIEDTPLVNLPDELTYVIALKLDLRSLIKFCASNKPIKTWCQMDKLWREKCYQDFGVAGDGNDDPQLMYLQLMAKYNRNVYVTKITGNIKSVYREMAKVGPIDYLYRYKDNLLVYFRNATDGERLRRVQSTITSIGSGS